MSIKKELVCHIETLEEGEFVKINRVETDPGYFLLTLGQNRIVVNGAELTDAINSIGFYATLFDEERKRREQAAKPIPKVTPEVVQAPAKKRKGKNDEEEGTIILEPSLRLGPTESELALEKQTKHMQGETLVIKEKK